MASNPPSSDAEGRSIGSYRVVRRLGSGGMGEVLLAHDDRLDRPVAIKRLRGDLLIGPAGRERLRREARAIARLNHPAIVQIYDIIEGEEGDSIVMEFVDGRTLFELLGTAGLDAATAMDALIEVADGLEAAHQQGLVHRDLKAENVMISPDGDAKILDFGIVKSTDTDEHSPDLTTEGVVGTYRSISPEQCDGQPVDARSDLFSLGVLMYEIFAGRSPFAGKTPVQTLARVVGVDPPPASEHNRSLPEPLSDLIEELLRKDPLERPGSAADVAEELEALRDAVDLAGIAMPRLDLTLDGTEAESAPSPAKRAVSIRRRRASSAAARTRGDRTTRPGRGRPGRLPGGAPIWIAVGLVAAVGVVVMVAVPRGTGARALDPNRVVVFPLVAPASLPPTAGEDVATMIGHALDGVEPLRWIDGWSLLDVNERSDARSLDLNRAGALARSRAARYFTTGRMSLLGDSVRVFVDLREATTGEEVARGERSGPATDPWRAGLLAMNEVLPALIGTDAPDVAGGFSEHRPDAVAHFLLGERELRRARMLSALAEYRRAFDADSSFALAAIRGAQAAAWEHEAEEASGLLAAVDRTLLTSRDRHFVDGLLAFVESRGDDAVMELSSALAEDSLFAVAWYQLGETYRHLIPEAAPPDTVVAPFDRALDLEPQAAHVLFHVIETLLQEGDTASARPLFDQYVAQDPDPSSRRQLEYQRLCLERGASADEWRVAAEDHPSQVAGAARSFASASSQLPCAAHLFRTVLLGDTSSLGGGQARYWSAFIGLVSQQAATRNFERAAALLDAAPTGPDSVSSIVFGWTDLDLSAGGRDPGAIRPPASVPARNSPFIYEEALALVAGSLYPELAAPADRAAERLRARPDPEGWNQHLLYALALWELRTNGATQAAATLTGILRARSLGAADNPTQSWWLGEVQSLGAWSRLAQGDSVGALSALRALRVTAPDGVVAWNLLAPLPVARLLRAELELSLGDRSAALSVLRGFDSPAALIHLLAQPRAAQICVRAAQAVGDPARERFCEQRLRTLGWPVGDIAAAPTPHREFTLG